MTVRCIKCQQYIDTSITEDQLKEWKNSHRLIQDVMPNVSKEERELLISGYCNKCFEELFRTTEEEHDDRRFDGD